MSEAVQFYCLTDPSDALARLAALRTAQPGHTVRFWQPGLAQPLPPGGFDVKLASYTPMYWLGLFATGDYGAVLVCDRHGAIDHRAMIMPRFARFPFMGRDDLQVGATFTRPEARGQGLALRGLLEVVAHHMRTGRRFWYLTDADNQASVAVMRKAGFALAGVGGKQPRYGLRAIGFYDMSPPAPEPSRR